jgi:hypothetical protein
MTAQLACPKCFLTDEKLGTCGNFALGCPTPIQYEPDTMVHITCIPCSRDVAIPVERIMNGKTRSLGGCGSDKCKAKMVPAPLAPTASPKPTPAKK